MPGFPDASGHVQMEPDGSHTPDSPAGGGALTSPVTRGLLLLGWQDGGTRGPPQPAPLSTREGTWGQGGPARGSPPPGKGPQKNLPAPGPCGSRSPPPLSGLHTPRFCWAGVCERLDVRLIGKALALRWLRHRSMLMACACTVVSPLRSEAPSIITAAPSAHGGGIRAASPLTHVQEVAGPPHPPFLHVFTPTVTSSAQPSPGL